MLVVFTLCVSNNKKMNINGTQSKLQSIGLILMNQTAKSQDALQCLSPQKQEALQFSDKQTLYR